VTMDELRRDHPGVYEIFMARLREKIIERTSTPTIMGFPVYEVGQADPVRFEYESTTGTPVSEILPVNYGYPLPITDFSRADELIDYNESRRIFDAFGVRFPG